MTDGSAFPLGSVRRRVTGGFLWAMSGRVLFLLTGVAISAVVTRLLPPAHAGYYFLALSLASGLTVVAGLGLQSVAVRLTAESQAAGLPGRARAALRVVFRGGVAGAVVTGAILLLPPTRGLLQPMFDAAVIGYVALFLAVMVVLRTLGTLCAETFRGFHDIRLASVFTGLDSNVLALCGLGLLLLVDPAQAGLRSVLGITAAAWLPGLLLAAALLRSRIGQLQGPGSAGTAEITRIAWPLWVLAMATVVLTQADLWVVGFFLEADQAALYGAALRLIALVSTPLLVMNAVVPPLVAAMYAQGQRAQLERVLRVTATVAGIPATAVMLVFVIGGDTVLGLVFGEFYREGGPLLAILSIGQLCNVWVGSCGFMLTMTGHERTVMHISLGSAALMLVLAGFAVGPFGAVGVAASAAVGLITKNLLVWSAARRLTGVSTHIGVRLSVGILREQLEGARTRKRR